jgi:predicted outer membrane repeat protein
MIRCNPWLLLPVTLLMAPWAAATVHHVPGDFFTIQHALIDAAAGDTVLVAPETYYENVNWPATPSLRLLSEAGAEATTIDGMGGGSVIRFSAPLDSSTVIRGFTITHGQAENGGGIACVSASPLIVGNRIVANFATDYGAGIYCTAGVCTPIIRDNLFLDNSVLDGSGGGVCACSDAFPTIVGNEFRGNHADAYYGGAIHCEEASGASRPIVIAGNSFRENSAWGGGAISIWNPYAVPPDVRDNEIIGNTAEAGGGAYFYWATSVLSRNTIRENHATQFGGGIFAQESHALVVRDCDISANSTDGPGGGLAIAWWNSAPLISGNTIRGNTAADGAGLYLYYYSSPTLRDNQIIENVATGTGGAIYCDDLCSPVLEANLILNNQAGYVGGVYVNGSQPSITDCTIADNGDIGILFAGAWAGHVPTVHANAIHGHTDFGLTNADASLTIAAESNWWGDATGPYHPLLNPGGLGDRVGNQVSFIPWLSDPIGPAAVTAHAAGGVRLSCRPNPFAGSTRITYRLADATGARETGRAALMICDVAGRCLRTLPLDRRTDGWAGVDWDGCDRGGRPVPAGVYYVRLDAGGAKRSLRLVRL